MTSGDIPISREQVAAWLGSTVVEMTTVDPSTSSRSIRRRCDDQLMPSTSHTGRTGTTIFVAPATLTNAARIVSS